MNPEDGPPRGDPAHRPATSPATSPAPTPGGGPTPRPSGLPARVLARLRQAIAIYEGIAHAPWRAAIHRRYRDRRDAFLLAAFSDALGVPNPVEFYTLELLPDLMDEFHDWHRRAGLERAPDGGWRCC